MELLNNDNQRSDVTEATSVGADDTHRFVVRGIPSDNDEDTRPVEPSAAASTNENPLLSTAESGSEAASFRPLPLPLRTPARRKICKTLQLLLLRKYVQCAKELDSIPDRATTEQLLDQAYDEFYFHGGDVNEQRMGYTAFIKLVRNRRGEFMRLSRVGRDQSRDAKTSHHKKHTKELEEIHILVAELERVRRSEGQRRASHGLDSIDNRETSHDSGTNSHTETMPSSHTVVNGEEHILISKRKLELILQSTQETLETQVKLLDQVRALERQLTELQRSQYPLRH